MPYKEFQENLANFSALLDQLPTLPDDYVNELIKHHVEQNIMLLNDIFSYSIDNLKKLQQVKNANDIICMQVKFTNEISKKLSLSTQRFLNASLGQVADYNEWLKAHCDLATD